MDYLRAVRLVYTEFAHVLGYLLKGCGVPLFALIYYNILFLDAVFCLTGTNIELEFQQNVF